MDSEETLPDLQKERNASGYGLSEVFRGPRKGMCSGLERCGDVCSNLDAWMWFGDGSSKAAVSTLLCGGVAVSHGRTDALLFADARDVWEMDIPRAGHWLRGTLILQDLSGRTGLSPGEPYPG